jgi:hypothetical protein
MGGRLAPVPGTGGTTTPASGPRRRPAGTGCPLERSSGRSEPAGAHPAGGRRGRPSGAEQDVGRPAGPRQVARCRTCEVPRTACGRRRSEGKDPVPARRMKPASRDLVEAPDRPAADAADPPATHHPSREAPQAPPGILLADDPTPQRGDEKFPPRGDSVPPRPAVAWRPWSTTRSSTASSGLVGAAGAMVVDAVPSTLGSHRRCRTRPNDDRAAGRPAPRTWRVAEEVTDAAHPHPAAEGAAGAPLA